MRDEDCSGACAGDKGPVGQSLHVCAENLKGMRSNRESGISYHSQGSRHDTSEQRNAHDRSRRE